MTNDNQNQGEQFLNLNPKKGKGKFKIYIGMSAGVGKTYRMLQEAHNLLQNGINIKVGYVETHGRKETQALIEGLPDYSPQGSFLQGQAVRRIGCAGYFITSPGSSNYR